MPARRHAEPSPPPRVVCWLLVVSWCALIFAFSAQPDLRITDADLLDLVARKLAHATVFGTLALLVSMTLRQEGIAATRARWIAALATLAWAASDEFHQTFVSGRSGHPRDVVIDMVGALLALWIIDPRVARRHGQLRSAQPDIPVERTDT